MRKNPLLNFLILNVFENLSKGIGIKETESIIFNFLKAILSFGKN
jgi:hypothetical protein